MSLADAAAGRKPPRPKPIRDARQGWMSTPGDITKDNMIWGNTVWGQWQDQYGRGRKGPG